MIWIQGLICFAIWIVYGFVQSRRSDEIRKKLAGQSRKRRAWNGAVFMLAGAAGLFVILILAHGYGGFSANGMTPLTMVAVAVGGLGFVHAQTMAMATLVSLMYDGIVTSESVSPSDKKEPTQVVK